MTWVEVKTAIDNGSGVILPIGSTEQHGYHLPLSVDVLLPEALAIQVADTANMLVAPPVAYGYRSRPLSGGGQTFVGTTAISGKTLMCLVEDILEEFSRQGFKRIALLSWHWENQNFIYEAAFLVTSRHPDIKIVVLEVPFNTLSDETMAFLFPEGFPGWAIEHAAIMETSLMLHLYPELVQFEKAIDDCAQESPFYEVLPIQPQFYPQSGILWKATQASAQKGQRAWGEICASTQAVLKKELSIQ